MLPPLTHPVWKRLVTGEKELKSSNVAINLLLFNSKLRYKKDPSSTNLTFLIMHAYEVFQKQELVMERSEIQELSS